MKIENKHDDNKNPCMPFNEFAYKTQLMLMWIGHMPLTYEWDIFIYLYYIYYMSTKHQNQMSYQFLCEHINELSLCLSH